MRLRALALLGGLTLLLFPATALAQSAGDKQYSDPFAGQSPSGSSPSPSPTAQAPSSSQPSGSGSQTASQPSTGSSAGAGDSSSSSSSPSGQLPRTGLRAWLLAAIGALMLLAGALLRFVALPLLARGTSPSPPVLGRDVRLRRNRR
jgi:hypothetical protein